MIANSCRLFNNTEEKIMKLKEFINKAVSVAMCAMIIGTTVVSVNEQIQKYQWKLRMH